MNFGIIGFGKIARKFVQAIEATDEGKIYAISSRSVSMDDPYIKEHPEVKVYKDYEELLNDPQVDAVYIALTHKFALLYLQHTQIRTSDFLFHPIPLHNSLSL